MPTALSFLIALAFLTAPAAGATAPRGTDDLCTPPKSMPSKAHEITAAGVTLRIPRGFLIVGSTSDYQVYAQGPRSIGVQWGRAPGMLETGGVLDPMHECHTVISGRPVTISLFRYTNIDAPMAPSGDAGTKYVALAQFAAAAGSHAVGLWIYTQYENELARYRWVFWTVSFGPGQLASDASPAAGAAGAGASPSSAPTAPACLRMLGPSEFPPLEAIVDTGLVQMLAHSAGPFPAGHAVVALQYDSTGGLAGVSVDESDLPEASQRQLASLVSTNVRPHPAGAPRTLRVRVDSDSTGLRYGVAPACAAGGN